MSVPFDIGLDDNDLGDNKGCIPDKDAGIYLEGFCEQGLKEEPHIDEDIGQASKAKRKRKGVKRQDEIGGSLDIADDRDFQCYICGFVDKPVKVVWHIKKVHKKPHNTKYEQYGPIRAVSCDLCKACFKSKEDKGKHVCPKDTSDFQCYLCGLLDKRPAIKEHVKTVHLFQRAIFNNMYGLPRPFSCNDCKACLATQDDLDKHICFSNEKVEPGKDGLYHCKSCIKAYSTYRGLKHHRITTHTDKRMFECPNCSFATKNKGVLRKHIKGQHEKVVNHSCPVCGKGFYLKYFCDQHVTKCLGNASGLKPIRQELSQSQDCKLPLDYPCKTCDKVFESPQALVSHNKRKHIGKVNYSETIHCEKCSNEISSNWMPNHLAMDHPSAMALQEVSSKCNLCWSDFPMAEDLSTHMLNEHSSAMKIPFMCHLCNEKFCGNSSFERHVAESHKRLVLTCDQCSYFTKVQSILSFHKLKKHSKEKRIGPNTDLFSCDICGNSQTDQKQHMYMRHPDFLLHCTICTLVLEGKSDLTEHMVAVHKQSAEDALGLYEKLLTKAQTTRKSIKRVCPHCGKSVSNLLKHIQVVHEKDKQKRFLCDQCDFSTIVKGSLRRHMEAIHLKTTMYHCEQCSYKSVLQSAVNSHVKMVHDKVKPFKCDRCEMAYGYTRDLHKHLAKVHGYVVPKLKDV